SSIANYLALDNIGGFLSPAAMPDAATRYRAALGEAARYISVYWMGAMVGRFIGSGLLQKIKPSKLLAFAAMMAGLLATTSVFTNGHVAMWTILSVGLFNSIMRSEEHTSELQSRGHLVCRLLLEKKKQTA